MLLEPQNAWSNGKSEFLVCVPAQLGSSPSVYLAEFLGFARLRPFSDAAGLTVVLRHSHVPRRCPTAKVLRCRDVGLDCEGELRADTEEEILRKAAEHAQTAHNVKDLSPKVVEKVRAAIRDE
jgi:predicted small metal-binding protein